MVMGAGHPYYRTDASKIENPTDNDFGYVGGKEIWKRLANGQTDYAHIETKQDFKASAAGKLNIDDKTKFIGTVQNVIMLQYSRPGVTSVLLTNVPGLPTMPLAALNVLEEP